MEKQQREKAFILSHEVENIDALLDFILQLFKSEQYNHAGQVWKRIDYKDFQGSRFSQNLDFLKIVLRIRDA